MSFTLCTSGAILAKAGENVNSTIAASGALLALFCDEAEAEIVATTTFDWVTSYSTVSTGMKPMLANVTSAIAALKLVNYDMSTYPSQAEAETKLDYLTNTVTRGLEVLRDKRVQDFMRAV